METTEIFVPLFVWLLGGSRIGGSYNTYFGSCTEQPDKAAWGQKVFNYVIGIEKTEDGELLKASVYGGLRSFAAATADDDVTAKAFPCAEESLGALREWLEAQRADFFAQDAANG